LLPAAKISDANGPDALHDVFAAVLATPASRPGDSAQAWERVQDAFTALERGLMAQAAPTRGPDVIPSYATKARLAWALVQDSVWLLTQLDAENPSTLVKLRDEVARMDEASRP